VVIKIAQFNGANEIYSRPRLLLW